MLSPYLERRWNKVRNVILAVMKMNKISRDVIMFGTSEKLFNNKRKLSTIRDFMLPEITKRLYS